MSSKGSIPKSPKRWGSTFSNQEKLPKLPVPELKQTLSRWLTSIEPLVKGDELEKVKVVTSDFGKAGGIGEILTKKLQERKAEKQNTSWLAEWWSSWAYMGYRESIVINVSYQYIFDELPQQMPQVLRGADMILAMLRVKTMIETETLPPDEIKGVPQCMSSYSNIFGACRIPNDGDDFLRRFPPSKSRHVIIASNNQFYSLMPYSSNGETLSRTEIAEQLYAIQQHSLNSNLSKENPQIGIFTTQHRDTWTSIRKDLLQSSINKTSMDVIESSAFVVNLDSYQPTSADDKCHVLLHGAGSTRSSLNRFYDKPFNLIIFPDGSIGLVGEHSGIDGYPATVVTDIAWEDLSQQQVVDLPFLKKPVASSASLDSSLLKFDVSGGKLRQQLAESVEYHNKNVANLVLKLLVFDHFGQDVIKAIGVSPDGFLQMAYQLAYYRLHKCFVPIYESCSTRKYLHGRTEVGRSLSNDSVRFVEAFDNPNLSDQQKYDLFKHACESHIEYIKEASDGQGCDRHILGMKLIANDDQKKHPFFSLPAHSKTATWKLSTSQLPSKHSVTGFGPVDPEGYGIFYNIRKSSLNFHISSFKNSPNPAISAPALAAALSQVLDDIYTLCGRIKPIIPKVRSAGSEIRAKL